MSAIPYKSAHSASGSAATSVEQSGNFSASRQSGRASQNFAVVSQVFLDAWNQGDFDTGRLQSSFEDLVTALAESGPGVAQALNLSDLQKLPTWSFDAVLHLLMKLAVYASKQVYALRTVPAIRDAISSASGARRLIDASPGTGGAKNWALFRDDSDAGVTFCFAIRGTATSGLADALADNLTNLDAGKVPLQDRLDILVHQGFKAAGQAIAKPFVDAINKAWTAEQASTAAQKPVLVLTGHSAGGGTAFFLYHCLLRDHLDLLQRFKCVYCLTFGSAAVTSSGSSLEPRPGDHVVSFILTDDPVPRLDLDYAQWVAQSMGIMLSNRSGGTKAAYPPLPPQGLFPGGQLVLLEDGETSAREMGPSTLSAKAFLALQNHKCQLYATTVDNLEA